MLSLPLSLHNAKANSDFALKKLLRIDRGSLGGALHSGTSIHNHDGCNGIIYIF